MRFTTRELVILAVFGALWGIVEMSLGTVLKSLHIPMSGSVLAAIGLTFALVGRLFVPRRGSTFFVGVIAMFLKLFSLGGVVVGPMIGILSEALLAELALSLYPRPKRLLFMLAGALGVTWPLAQPFITNPLLYGRSLTVVWLDLLDQGTRLLNIDQDAAWLIVAALIAIRMVIGAAAGWFAWQAGAELQKRLGKTPASFSQPLETKSSR